MKILNSIKRFTLIGMAVAAPIVASPIYAQVNNQERDTFERVIKAGGITDPNILKNAPLSDVTVNGETQKAVFVVDIRNHLLYKYDDKGNAIKAYPVATGRKGYSTPEGIYSIGWVEYKPYKTAPKSTKRSRQPYLFGDKAIVLYKVDPKTGKKNTTGIMVHGHKKGDEGSIGTDASLGCVRLFNPDICEFAEEMKYERGKYCKFVK